MRRSVKFSPDVLARVGVTRRRCNCERCQSGRRHQYTRVRDAAEQDVREYEQD